MEGWVIYHIQLLAGTCNATAQFVELCEISCCRQWKWWLRNIIINKINNNNSKHQWQQQRQIPPITTTTTTTATSYHASLSFFHVFRYANASCTLCRSAHITHSMDQKLFQITAILTKHTTCKYALSHAYTTPRIHTCNTHTTCTWTYPPQEAVLCTSRVSLVPLHLLFATCSFEQSKNSEQETRVSVRVWVWVWCVRECVEVWACQRWMWACASCVVRNEHCN